MCAVAKLLTCRWFRWAASTKAQAEPSYRQATRMMPSCCSRLAYPAASCSLLSFHSLLSMVIGRGVLFGTTVSRRYLAQPILSHHCFGVNNGEQCTVRYVISTEGAEGTCLRDCMPSQAHIYVKHIDTRKTQVAPGTWPTLMHASVTVCVASAPGARDFDKSTAQDKKPNWAMLNVMPHVQQMSNLLLLMIALHCCLLAQVMSKASKQQCCSYLSHICCGMPI